ncbi:MAG: hypothetical protein RLY31_1281 [Bacteroidota bacterium]|jgi:membrane associated rhomboid family serine protease
MFDSIWHDIRRQLSYGNMVTRIMLVNIAVFVLAVLVRLFLLPFSDGQGLAFQQLVRYLEIGADWRHNLFHPWVFLTHMFLHLDVWHILWNMLMLHWFGRITGDLLGDRRILPIYLLGGLAGGLAFFVMANVPTPWSVGSYALGASAAVMAVLVVAGKTAPDYNITLLLFGNVRLKYLVAALVLLDVVALSHNDNSGGSFGHLGGALLGYILADQLQRGNDLTRPVNRWLEQLQSFLQGLRPSPTKRDARKPYVVYRRETAPRDAAASGAGKTAGRNDRRQPVDQDRLDAILDKIKQSGYDSLSAAEKQYLFDASNK